MVARDDLQIAILPQLLAIEPHFVRKGSQDKRGDLKSQFYFNFWRSNIISCKRVARDDLEIATLHQFLAIEPHFVRKGCAGQVEIAILPHFLAIEPHFVRNGCVSCRLVGTAPAPAFKREIEKKEERARGQEGKRARGQEGKI